MDKQIASFLEFIENDKKDFEVTGYGIVTAGLAMTYNINCTFIVHHSSPLIIILFCLTKSLTSLREYPI